MGARSRLVCELNYCLRTYQSLVSRAVGRSKKQKKKRTKIAVLPISISIYLTGRSSDDGVLLR